MTLLPVARRGSRLWQTARTQLWYKALDAVVTAPARPRSTLRSALRLLLDPRQAHYDRVGALVNAADHLLPGTAARLGRSLLQPDALPLTCDSIDLLAYGSGGTAYRLRRGDERWVLKIYRRSLGLSGRRLDAIAREFQQKVATVAGWYDQPLQLVAPVQFLLVHSPLRRAPALASLQRYLLPPHRDLFADFSGEQLLRLGREDPDFWQQLQQFVHTTLRVYEEEGRCLDFIGVGNVVVIPFEGQRRLVILDYGIFDVETLASRAPKTLVQVQQRVERLRALQASLQPVSLPQGQRH